MVDRTGIEPVPPDLQPGALPVKLSVHVNVCCNDKQKWGDVRELNPCTQNHNLVPKPLGQHHHIDARRICSFTSVVAWLGLTCYIPAVPYSDPEKHRTYQRERNRRLRHEWLEANGPCAACGSGGPYDVDHKDPLTKVSHNVWTWSAARRAVELAKCQVLCTSCHKKKTAKERYKPIIHGTVTAYFDRDCRCLLCKEAARLTTAAYRRRKKKNHGAEGVEPS